jgi:hypothetical protein
VPIDINNLYSQITQLSPQIVQEESDFTIRLEAALDLVKSQNSNNNFKLLQKKLKLHRHEYQWTAPDLTEPFTASYNPSQTPKDFIVLSVDGSQIEPDRDSPADCFLVNTGEVVIQYGTSPQASLSNTPYLFWGDYKNTQNDQRYVDTDIHADSSIIAAIRDTYEIKAMTRLVSNLPSNMPSLGILDGSLSQWRITSQNSRIQNILLTDYLEALEELKELASTKNLVIVSYISAPATKESINALRIDSCPFSEPKCKEHCSDLPALSRPCDLVAKVRDRDVFHSLLKEGQRSALFNTRSTTMDHYGSHTVSYFYMKTKDEIVRIEIPNWSTSSLDLAHNLVWNQIDLGNGYPVALHEAHEQAVIRSSDRNSFWRIIDNMDGNNLINQGLSRKNIAKKRRKV